MANADTTPTPTTINGYKLQSFVPAWVLAPSGDYKGDKQIQKTVNRYIDVYRFRGFKELVSEYSKAPTLLFETTDS